MMNHQDALVAVKKNDAPLLWVGVVPFLIIACMLVIYMVGQLDAERVFCVLFSATMVGLALTLSRYADYRLGSSE